MATVETLDDRLQKVKDELKSIYLTKIKETKGGNDKKRAACWAIHDQFKPNELCPSEFPIDSADRYGRNDPKTAVARTSDLADCEEKAINVNPKATPKLGNPQDSKKLGETPDGKDGKSLKPRKLFEIMIDFKLGRKDPEHTEHLKKELKEAVAREDGSAAEKSIKTFVDKHIIEQGNRMLGPVSVSMNTVKTSNYREYISCKVIELSLAGQVVWETDDGKAEEGTTNFWEFNYSERRLIEASQLYSCIKSKPTHLPRTGGSKNLLPVTYWKKEKEEKGGFVWMGYDPATYKDGSKESYNKLPPWATEYLNQKNLDGEMMQFSPDIEKPFDYHNSVYLLLCRFNKGGDEQIVQAYAGKATNGVQSRWVQHAGKSTKLIQSYYELETFSESPLSLGSPLLVEVVIGRLYAQHGRKGIVDNIALFVYHAYGENAAGDNTKANTKMMETEGVLIRDLELTKMECGMNGIEPKDEENKAENVKNAEAGDKAKKEDVKKTE